MHARVLLVAVVAALLPAGIGGAAPNFVVKRDYDIGGFSLIREPTVHAAIAVFGNPSTRRDFGYDHCILGWPNLGVTMRTFFTGGADVGVDPCGPRGRHYKTTITSRRWKTSAGLRVGDKLGRLRGLYRRAKRDPDGSWVLIARPLGGVLLPTLTAVVKNGRVSSIVVRGPRTPF